MNQIHVGVVRGGSNLKGYSKSISDGSILLRALREHEDYIAHDILIDKKEVWHLDGVPIIPAKLSHQIDICISTIEHPLKEHGHVEPIIRSLGIRCIHSPKSALKGYIPDSLKQNIYSAGVRSVRHIEIGGFDDTVLSKIHKTFSPPYVISFVNIAGEVNHIFHATTLDDAYEVLANHVKEEPGNYMIEEFIPGEKWAITVIPDFRGVRHYTTHPVYLGLVNPPFRSNIPVSRSAEHGFADPYTKSSLDLYAKLASSVMETNHPKTFVFHFEQNKKPVLMRIIDRHILHDDYNFLQTLKESGITEGEFLKLILDRK